MTAYVSKEKFSGVIGECVSTLNCVLVCMRNVTVKVEVG